MELPEEIDQFQLLEKKIDDLINRVTALRKEKESLEEKIQIQEGKVADLTSENESLKSARDSAKQRLVKLLERIEHLGL